MALVAASPLEPSAARACAVNAHPFCFLLGDADLRFLVFLPDGSSRDCLMITSQRKSSGVVFTLVEEAAVVASFATLDGPPPGVEAVGREPLPPSLWPVVAFATVLAGSFRGLAPQLPPPVSDDVALVTELLQAGTEVHTDDGAVLPHPVEGAPHTLCGALDAGGSGQCLQAEQAAKNAS